MIISIDPLGNIKEVKNKELPQYVIDFTFDEKSYKLYCNQSGKTINNNVLLDETYYDNIYISKKGRLTNELVRKVLRFINDDRSSDEDYVPSENTESESDLSE